MHHPTNRISHAAAFVTPVVEHGWNEIYFFIKSYGDNYTGKLFSCESSITYSSDHPTIITYISATGLHASCLTSTIHETVNFSTNTCGQVTLVLGLAG